MVDTFKRAAFIQHFIKDEKKIMMDGVGSNLFQNKFFVQHFVAYSSKNKCWIRLKWFTIQHLTSSTISKVGFNVFQRSNDYSNVFIKNNKR